MAKILDRETYEQKLKRAAAVKKAKPKRTVRAPMKKTKAKVKAVAKSFAKKGAQKKTNPAHDVLLSNIDDTSKRLVAMGASVSERAQLGRQALLSYGQGMVAYALLIKAISTATAKKCLLTLREAARV